MNAKRSYTTTNQRVSPPSQRASERAQCGAASRLSIVLPCPLSVALGRQVEVGEHACPDCGQRLGGRSGYWRWICERGTLELWIRRGRCSGCRRSHVLLPGFLLDRRLDEVEVIGRALMLAIVIGRDRTRWSRATATSSGMIEEPLFWLGVQHVERTASRRSHAAQMYGLWEGQAAHRLYISKEPWILTAFVSRAARYGPEASSRRTNRPRTSG
jgi:hypothetical protein